MQTQRALPKQPTPQIPRIPNPTPQQTHAALQLVHNSMHQALGPNPSTQRIAQYQQELANDPRQQEFAQTVQHYVRAAEGHLSAMEGRRVASGNPLISQAPRGAGTRLSRDAAVRLGHQAQAPSVLGRPEAKPLAAPKDVALPLLGLATVRVPGTAGLAGKLGSLLAAITPGLQGNTPEANFANAALGDVKAVGELPFVGGYKVAEAGVQAAGGNTKPARQLASGVAQGISQGAVGQLVQGNLPGVERAVREHPVFAALEALGAGGVVGRGAGALARTAGSQAERAGVRGALARAGSEVRPPLGLTPDAGAARQGLVRQRDFSPDLFRKAAQILADKRRQPVLDANGKPVTIVDRGRRVPVLQPSKRQLETLPQRRANFESSRSVAVERHEREQAAKHTTAAEATPNRLPDALSVLLTPKVRGRLHPVRVPGKATPITAANLGRHLTQLVATGTIRGVGTFKQDLLKRAEVIEHAVQHPELYRTEGTKANPGELRVARANAALLRKAAENPRVLKQAPAIVAQGLEHAKQLTIGDRELARLSVHPKAELDRAALSEYALAHMNAQHFTAQDHARAEATAGTAADKLAVSGRDPALVAAHDAARTTHGKAELVRKQAARRVQTLDSQLARKKGAARRSQGSGANRVPMRRSDALAIRKLEQQVKSARQEHLVAAKQKRLAMQGQRENPLPARQPGLRHPDGRWLSNAEIRAHAKAHGRNPDTLAYLPHVVGTGDPRSFHRQFRPGGRPVAAGERRTGVLFQRGANAISRDLVREELTAKGTTVAKTQMLDRLIQESGVRHPAVEKARAGHELTVAERRIVDSGGYMTTPEARDLSQRLNADGKGDWIPVTAFAAKLSKDTQAALRDAQSPAAMETAHLSLLHQRVAEGPNFSRARNVVLLPAHQVNQLERQLRPAGEIEKAIQLMNGPFRMAVLPQPRWLTGNFIEPFFVRMPLSGSGANLPGLALDLAAGHRALSLMEKSGDPKLAQAAKEIRAQQFQGLFIGKRNATIHRTYRDFTGNTQRALYGAHVLRNLPAVKQLADLTLSIPHGFFTFNRLLEGSLQRAAFGKQVRRDIQQWTGNWRDTILLGKQAVEEASKGLVSTPTQHRFMEKQHELLGQYDTFSPTLRRAIQGAFPFLPWTLASLRFVFWTLPAHHTVAFDGLVKAAQAVLPEWEAQHNAILSPSAKEGTLADAAIRSDRGLVDIARYTPYGATIPPARGDFTNLVGTAFPQLSGSLEALHGRDPFGRELQLPKTPGNPKGATAGGDKALIAANSLFESMVPLVAQARRLQERGGTAYGNSTIFSPKVKPESSHMSALERTLNPFRATYLKPPTSSGGAIDPLQQHLVQQAEQEVDQHHNDPLLQKQIREAEEEADRAAALHR